jgi:hypothetical protein
VLSGWPNKSRWLDEPMPSELLKAAVSGSIWRPLGGLGTLEQIHSPFRVLSRGVPPPRHQPHRGGPARQSSLDATPMERTSMIGAPKARSPWLPRRSRPSENEPPTLPCRGLARGTARARGFYR